MPPNITFVLPKDFVSKLGPTHVKDYAAASKELVMASVI